MTLTQQHRVALTVIAILLGIAIIVAGFVHRIQQPRIMTVSEMRANGLFIFDTPRDPGKFVLTNHKGAEFTDQSLEGDWTLLFFGFTYCPDVCPTTLSFLAELKGSLEGTEASVSPEIPFQKESVGGGSPTFASRRPGGPAEG